MVSDKGKVPYSMLLLYQIQCKFGAPHKNDILCRKITAKINTKSNRMSILGGRIGYNSMVYHRPYFEWKT